MVPWDGEAWNRRMRGSRESHLGPTERPDHWSACGTMPEVVALGRGKRCRTDCPCPCHLIPTDAVGRRADELTGVPE